MSVPVLYTFRRCPYAIRARMALACSGIDFEVREVALRSKPQQLLDISAKATVPVLLLTNGCVMEESLEILHWALNRHDPHGWKAYSTELLSLMDALVEENDTVFKFYLDRYKYADRFPESSRQHYRQQAEKFLITLETRLGDGVHLFGNKRSFADIAVFPFVRQFSKVEPQWFNTAPYPNLHVWLSTLLESELFTTVMTRYVPWQPEQSLVLYAGGAEM